MGGNRTGKTSLFLCFWLKNEDCLSSIISDIIMNVSKGNAMSPQLLRTKAQLSVELFLYFCVHRVLLGIENLISFDNLEIKNIGLHFSKERKKKHQNACMF